MSETTAVAAQPAFADRKTEKLIDGQTVEGWFTEDFTLAELKTLRARERLPRLRSTDYDGRFEIPTFEEILTLLAEVNRTRDEPVGVSPESSEERRVGKELVRPGRSGWDPDHFKNKHNRRPIT